MLFKNRTLANTFLVQEKRENEIVRTFEAEINRIPDTTTDENLTGTILNAEVLNKLVEKNEYIQGFNDISEKINIHSGKIDNLTAKIDKILEKKGSIVLSSGMTSNLGYTNIGDYIEAFTNGNYFPRPGDVIVITGIMTESNNGLRLNFGAYDPCAFVRITILNRTGLREASALVEAKCEGIFNVENKAESLIANNIYSNDGYIYDESYGFNERKERLKMIISRGLDNGTFINKYSLSKTMGDTSIGDYIVANANYKYIPQAGDTITLACTQAGTNALHNPFSAMDAGVFMRLTIIERTGERNASAIFEACSPFPALNNISSAIIENIYDSGSTGYFWDSSMAYPEQIERLRMVITPKNYAIYEDCIYNLTAPTTIGDYLETLSDYTYIPQPGDVIILACPSHSGVFKTSANQSVPCTYIRVTIITRSGDKAASGLIEVGLYQNFNLSKSACILAENIYNATSGNGYLQDLFISNPTLKNKLKMLVINNKNNTFNN